jgi:hypothetical protein
MPIKGMKVSAKVIRLRPKKRWRSPYKTAKSYEQLRQRELAWMLYITEGYIANLSHALAINCVTFTTRDTIAVQNIIAQVEMHATRLRDLMQAISEGP